MARNGFDYNAMVEQAMRDVVRLALGQAGEIGMPGNHHMMIGFRTDYPGVDIPGYLKQSYPQEMTIVLQHQFWDLEVRPELFSVTLSFNKIAERLTVPYAAITAFADPSVQFGLQFRVAPADPDGKTVIPTAIVTAPAPADAPAADTPPTEKPAGEVVALDAFRKKK